ncbi:hypothetical protein [Pseudomonas sp. DG56-2]|uniref:hypothetical protein n=1 Tax=Pseudomonas sp. DG56-2 TaxID=2320270 RepID=UPI0010A69BE1|nr:hypothetical protein [Pseudomonas sp. DG56-2]
MLFNLNKLPSLPLQLNWKYSDEPELLCWTICARNYNTFAANCIFAFMSLTTAGAAYFLYSTSAPNETELSKLTSCTGFYIFTMLIISCMTHQRMNFAYRFTKSGIEYCEWKEFPQWALTFLKWMTGITAIIFIFMATIDITFLIGALVGPGGMGLMYLTMANSKNYRDLHTQYHHYAYKWKEITQLAIATNREIVDLKYSVTQKGDNYKTNWNLNIYCKRNQKKNVAAFIKPYLSPGVAFIRAKVNVPLSTDY